MPSKHSLTAGTYFCRLLLSNSQLNQKDPTLLQPRDAQFTNYVQTFGTVMLSLKGSGELNLLYT